MERCTRLKMEWGVLLLLELVDMCYPRLTMPAILKESCAFER
jgi:hypothetical protein